jgi:hypothetical protein
MLYTLDQQQQAIDILSFEFTPDWPVQALMLLESKRDCFLTRQVLWWLSDTQLKSILPGLVQLRQLFEVFSLDDTLLASLSLAEISADIQYLQSVEDEQNQQPLTDLKTVALYLNEIKQA